MNNLKKLFMLRKQRGGTPIKGDNGNIIYYASKQDAKQARTDDQCVSYGVDHRKFNPTTQGKLK